jgi:hypothetical protein
MEKAPAELVAGYTRLFLTLVPQSARADLEELMFDDLKDDFVDGWIAKGHAQGEAQMLLRAMTARGLTIPEDTRLRVTECQDPAQVEAWFDRALTATTIDEIFT